MTDVACLFGAVLDEFERRDIAPGLLVEGLDVDPSTLRNPRRRVSWDQFAEMSRRTAMILGEDALEEVAGRAASVALPRPVQRALSWVVDPAAAYAMGARFWGPRIFRPTKASFEELDDGRLREVIEILPGFRESPEFFHGVRGLLRVMPRMFGLPDAEVELRHDGRRGEFTVTLATHGTAAHVPRSASHPTGTPKVLTKSPSRDSMGRLRQLVARVSNTRELVEGTLRLLEEQYALDGLRISRVNESPNPSPFDRPVERGDASGLPARVLTIRAPGGPAALLEVFEGSGRALLQEEAAELSELLPWLGLAIENADARENVRRLTFLLNDGLQDVRNLEQGLSGLLFEHSPLEQIGDAVASGGQEPVRMLLVEDDPGLRGLARHVLEAGGHDVGEAGSDLVIDDYDGLEHTVELIVADWTNPAIRPDMIAAALHRFPNLRGVLLTRLFRH